MAASLPTSPAYRTEQDLVHHNGTFLLYVYARPESTGPVPNTVPTDTTMPQYDWYENLEVLVFFQPAHGGPLTNVASLAACLAASVLRRDRVPGRFGESMSLFVTDEANVGCVSELEEVTLDFELDDLARFPRAQVERIGAQGLGVWGAELNHGNLVVVESTFVEPALWRRGLGRYMAQALVDVVRQKGDCTILLRPVFLGKKTYDALERDMGGAELPLQAKEEIAVACKTLPLAFWRAQGFRRIGTTEWLGWSSDPTHPATLVPRDQDADLDMEATYEY